ncbi:hypothetical protein LIER_41410 [Lithospermum erythrorhizon]|uniref:Uncharacterized protein n=1 Tax=Lithospermum erythrorhizon TaxID=34254 RepID=A0AAV3RAC7_LITER
MGPLADDVEGGRRRKRWLMPRSSVSFWPLTVAGLAPVAVVSEAVRANGTCSSHLRGRLRRICVSFFSVRNV